MRAKQSIYSKKLNSIIYKIKLKEKNLIHNLIPLIPLIFSKVSRMYFDDLEIEVPKILNYEKLQEILTILYNKLKLYQKQIKEHYSKKQIYLNQEKIMIFAEYMAFDFIYQNFKLQRKVFEKSLNSFQLQISY